MAKYFLSKNTRKEKDIHPDYIIWQVPEEKGGKWIEVGATWKAQSGKGHNVKFGNNVTINVAPKEFTKPEALKDEDDKAFDDFEKTRVEKPVPKEINVGGKVIDYPQGINPEDIPF